MEMLRFQVLAVLCSYLLLVRVSAAPQGEQLTEILQEDPINNKDLTHLVFMRFVSELMAWKEEMLHELEKEESGGGMEKLMRRHIRFTHRERKAGCRNFFWKTFTSC